MFKLILILTLSLFSFNCHAAAQNYEIVIKNHKFVPEKLELPSGERIKLKVINEDDTVEEFESHDLKREKIVPAKGSIIVSFGPLEPGLYKFFGEFHEETAQGVIEVK